MSKQKETEIMIYMVEDNEIYTMMLDQKLNQSLTSYHMRTFTTGEECIENINGNPDVVILDYHLPGKNGLEVLKEIKNSRPDIPVIILSHQKDIHVALELLENGAHNYIVKDKDSYLRVKNDILGILGNKKLQEENITLKLKINKFVIITTVSFIIMLGLAISIISIILAKF